MSIKKLTIIIVVIINIILMGQARSEPSMEETIKFILKKTHNIKDHTPHAYGHERHKVFIDKCNIEVETTYYNRNNWGSTIRTESVSLKNIDPSKVDIYKSDTNALHSVHLFSSEQKEIINITSTTFSCKKDPDLRLGDDGCKADDPRTESVSYSKTHLLGVRVKDPSYNAQKVAKAFKHLISLCGGKGELF